MTSQFSNRRRAEETPRRMVRQSGGVAIAAAAGVLAGLLLDVAIVARLGRGRQSDAFFIAGQIPLGIVAIVIAAANQALVPTFSTWAVRFGSTSRTFNELRSKVITYGLLIGFAMAGVLALLAGPLCRITAPGSSESTVALAAQSMRIFVLVIPFVAVAEVYRSLLNAGRSFIAPAAMNVLMNGVAAVLVIVGRTDVRYVAAAYVVGALVQLVFLDFIARATGILSYRPRLGAAGNTEMIELRARMIRPLGAASLNPVARLGEQIIVSFLPAGSITIVDYGNRLISAIGGTVFFRSVMVTLLPRLSEAVEKKDEEEVVRTNRAGIQLMLALSIPLTAMMAVLAKPAVLVLFRRGNFDKAAASLLGVTVAVYSLSLVGSALQRALLAPFFADLDTKTPLRNTIYGVVANLALLPLLTLPFRGRPSAAVIGVAVAYSAAQYVNVAHAWYRLREVGLDRDGARKRSGRVALPAAPFRGCGAVLVRATVSSVIAAAVMFFLTHLLGLDDARGRFDQLWRVAVIGTVGLAIMAPPMMLAFRNRPRRVARGARGGADGGPDSHAGPESGDSELR